MTRTTSITVPVTIRGRTLLVTYRVTVVANTGASSAESSNAVSTWGYARAVPVRVSSEDDFDIVIPRSGDGGRDRGGQDQ